MVVNTITGEGGQGAGATPQEVQPSNGASRLVRLIRKHCFVVGNSPRSVRGQGRRNSEAEYPEFSEPKHTVDLLPSNNKEARIPQQ